MSDIKNPIEQLGYSDISALFGSLINGKSDIGGAFGNMFSNGFGGFKGSPIYKGQYLMDGISKDAGASLAGTGAGLVSNYIGSGITSLGGNTLTSRGVGAGIASGLGNVGGAVLGNLVKYGNLTGDASKLFGTGDNILTTIKTTRDMNNATKLSNVGAINPYALGATILGTAVGAATGPSKEYGGRYGNITQTADSIYDAVSLGANFIPGYGQAISGALTLNKGLSNIFGSTDGMTKTDAILGSAFMPFPVKWINAGFGHTTDTIKGQNIRDISKVNNFMSNGFGNLGSLMDTAREESGKRYGLFSTGAYDDAQDNISFINSIWGDMLSMANQKDIQDIRSQYMSSMNNQRYAQKIRGGFRPLSVKQGMKIFNNATNHNIGMRLLSAAALIDDKQMILCNVQD